ncbi:hypothetical protein Pth03_29330 [Planotetraspora thailandica]|uniref:Uncharacterized protein n=1 Tax=Planotetraspora thailandica TaxID=487172 RepID=A0A8J3XVP1_9ACTN|nr:hypothetical protein Pth03_29330 [Planotetraspora thailandica]
MGGMDGRQAVAIASNRAPLREGCSNWLSQPAQCSVRRSGELHIEVIAPGLSSDPPVVSVAQD